MCHAEELVTMTCHLQLAWHLLLLRTSWAYGHLCVWIWLPVDCFLPLRLALVLQTSINQANYESCLKKGVNYIQLYCSLLQWPIGLDSR